MTLRSLFILLLFTVNASLASGQWEPDRFLFSSQVAPPRPKAVKSRLPSNIKADKAGAESTRKSPMSVESKPTTAMTSPAAEEPQTPTSSLGTRLQGHVGYLDFSAKGLPATMTAAKAQFAVGVRIEFNLAPAHSVQCDYLTTGSTGGGATAEQPSLYSKRWEDMMAAYTFETSLLGIRNRFGGVVRQSGWWGPGKDQLNSLEKISGVGLKFEIDGERQGQWVPALRVQVFPNYSTADRQLSGRAVQVEGAASLSLAPHRQLLLNVGYEMQSLKGSEDSRDVILNLDQRIMKAYIGYQVSTF